MLKERLANLRQVKGLTQQEFASLLEINRATYAQYETGRREPDYSVLEKIADFYNCTIDYLVGRTDDPHSVLLEIKRSDKDEELLKDPDIRAIARAAQNMPQEQRKDLARFLKKAFDKVFEKDE